MKFTIKTKIATSAQTIYEAWLSSKKHEAMTGGDAKCSKRLHAIFTAWDGYISGKNLELIANDYIKQSWRTVEFDDAQPDSVLEIKLKEIKPGITEITLLHSNLLPKDIKYKKGWIENYFNPMKNYFEK